jgi:hypothetical protein
MKKWSLLIIMSMVICHVASAEVRAKSLMEIANEGLNFSAPVVTDRTALTAVSAGTIVFETNTSGFYGLAPNVVGSSTNKWVLMGSTAGGPRSEISLSQGNGWGSTNTGIRRFSSTILNLGTDITYVDSTTAGASFTINTAGVYAISYSDYGAGAGAFGVSINSTQLTTNVNLIADTAIAVISYATSGTPNTASTTLNLNVGDVIRPHGNGVFTTTDSFDRFRITKVSN